MRVKKKTRSETKRGTSVRVRARPSSCFGEMVHFLTSVRRPSCCTLFTSDQRKRRTRKKASEPLDALIDALRRLPRGKWLVWRRVACFFSFRERAVNHTNTRTVGTKRRGWTSELQTSSVKSRFVLSRRSISTGQHTFVRCRDCCLEALPCRSWERKRNRKHTMDSPASVNTHMPLLAAFKPRRRGGGICDACSRGAPQR